MKNVPLPSGYWQTYALGTSLVDNVWYRTVQQILLPVVTYEEGINSDLDTTEYLWMSRGRFVRRSELAGVWQRGAAPGAGQPRWAPFWHRG